MGTDVDTWLMDEVEEINRREANTKDPLLQLYLDACEELRNHNWKKSHRRHTESLAIPDAYATEFSPQEAAELRIKFADFDLDSSGAISLDELAEVYTSLGEQPDADLLSDLMDEIDQDNDGEIQWKEFVRMFALFKRGHSKMFKFGSFLEKLNRTPGVVLSIEAKRRNLNTQYKVVEVRRATSYNPKLFVVQLTISGMFNEPDGLKVKSYFATHRFDGIGYTTKQAKYKAAQAGLLSLKASTPGIKFTPGVIPAKWKEWYIDNVFRGVATNDLLLRMTLKGFHAHLNTEIMNFTKAFNSLSKALADTPGWTRLFDGPTVADKRAAKAKAKLREISRVEEEVVEPLSPPRPDQTPRIKRFRSVIDLPLVLQRWLTRCRDLFIQGPILLLVLRRHRLVLFDVDANPFAAQDIAKKTFKWGENTPLGAGPHGLAQTVMADDVDHLRNYICGGANPSQTCDVSGVSYPLLGLAAMHGAVECVKLLCEKGADVSRSPDNNDPHRLVAKTKVKVVVEEDEQPQVTPLKRKGAKKKRRRSKRRPAKPAPTPKSTPRVSEMERLRAARAVTGTMMGDRGRDPLGRTAVHLACCCRDPKKFEKCKEVVAYLVKERHMSTTAQDKYGNLALHLAADSGNAQALEWLLIFNLETVQAVYAAWTFESICADAFNGVLGNHLTGFAAQEFRREWMLEGLQLFHAGLKADDKLKGNRHADIIHFPQKWVLDEVSLRHDKEAYKPHVDMSTFIELMRHGLQSGYINHKNFLGRTPLNCCLDPDTRTLTEGHEACVQVLVDRMGCFTNIYDRYGDTPEQFLLKRGRYSYAIAGEPSAYPPPAPEPKDTACALHSRNRVENADPWFALRCCSFLVRRLGEWGEYAVPKDNEHVQAWMRARDYALSGKTAPLAAGETASTRSSVVRGGRQSRMARAAERRYKSDRAKTREMQIYYSPLFEDPDIVTFCKPRDVLKLEARTEGGALWERLLKISTVKEKFGAWQVWQIDRKKVLALADSDDAVVAATDEEGKGDKESAEDKHFTELIRENADTFGQEIAIPFFRHKDTRQCQWDVPSDLLMTGLAKDSEPEIDWARSLLNNLRSEWSTALAEPDSTQTQNASTVFGYRIGSWEQCVDEFNNALYYYDHLTGRTSWDPPVEFAQEDIARALQRLNSRPRRMLDTLRSGALRVEGKYVLCEWGCGAWIRFGKAQRTHARELCGRRMMACQNKGCPVVMRADEWAIHREAHEKVCTKRTVPCPLLCGKRIVWDVVDHHLEHECSKRMAEPIHCRLGCGRVFLGGHHRALQMERERKSHEAHTCLLRQVTCTWTECQFVCLAKDLKEHLKTHVQLKGVTTWVTPGVHTFKVPRRTKELKDRKSVV